jgi:polyisoprenoid-binding protein YceI
MKLANVSAAIAATVATAAASAASPALKDVKAGTYKVESYHTQVGFSLLHFGFTNYSGLFSGATGTLRLDPSNPAASKLDVTIPVRSIVTTVPVLTDELKGDKWFDVAKFPQAIFTSTDVTFAPGGEVTIRGTLTLHGVTKPITLHAHLVGAGVNPLDKAYTVGFQAQGTIKRSDFGVSLYAPALGDDVELSIAGAFELEG